MAKALVWADFTPDQLAFILEPTKTFMTQVGNLAEVLKLDTSTNDPQTLIELDLYKAALAFSVGQGHTPEQMSATFSIVKSVHKKSVGESLVVDEAMRYFKKLMLIHSVHRPPYSIALFSAAATRTLTNWLLHSYFRHYKLYQYVYTVAVTMSVEQSHPSDIVELAPTLQALKDAATSEQHAETEAAAAAEAAKKAAEEEAEEVRKKEEAREEKIRAEYEGAVPDEVTRQVEKALERELALLHEKMEEQFSEQEASLLQRINELSDEKRKKADKSESKKADDKK